MVGGGNQVQKSDSDRDGITDDQDNCPRNTAVEISQGIDSNGCPLDSDRDNVADYRDSCPRNTLNEISQW